MTVEDIITQVLSAGALLGGIAALISSWRSRRAGIKSDEREARDIENAQRRDTIADRDSLIDQFQEELRELRSRVAAVEDTNEKYRRELALEKEYSRILLDWGYRGAPPPPPARPTH